MSDTQEAQEEATLKKNLTLFDVYSVSTGAMFSSGLFLLPGIAASYSGDSVYLAYFVAGFLILPAMFCIAELSTAMPKSGGTYYFLDRAMGPLLGTIGGLGSWIAVVFKSSFALVGMGAYLEVYIDLPLTLLAIALTIAFGIINVVGAKETSMLQRILVSVLVVILTVFIALGLFQLELGSVLAPNSGNSEFFKSGMVGFVSTIGLVFVSYAGLTKVASVAEEVENPDVNIPLGMILSLLTATIIYTLGTIILINTLPPDKLYSSLTPIADAGRAFLSWVPYDLGVLLIVVAAIAAFASTGNAGIMSASRYPFAMAKDRLIPERLAELGRFGTPTLSVFATVVAMILVLLVFDVESVAKLASAFQLLLFGLICVAVIVMRESRISSYRPGFNAPFYPWLPVLGILISFWLVIEMGFLPIAFTGMMIILCLFWYQFYASDNLERRGAIFHIHQRLGQHKYEGLERELMTIIHDRTQSENLSYETLIARSAIVDLPFGNYDLESLNEILRDSSSHLFEAQDEEEGGAELLGHSWDFRPVEEGLFLASRNDNLISRPKLIVCRFGPQASIEVEGVEEAHSLFFLITPEKPVGLDLRLAGHLAEVVQSGNFLERWLAAESESELNQILMRDDHFYHGPVSEVEELRQQVGKKIADIDLPNSCIIALIERDSEIIIATADVVLEVGDQVAIIGEPEDIHLLES